MQNDCFPEAVAEWPKRPISAIAAQSPRYAIEKGQEYPFVEMASVAEDFGGIIKFDSRKPEGSGLSRFKVHDTLFAKITPCPENGKVAFVDELPAETGLGSTEFIVLSPLDGTCPRFLYHVVCSYPIRGRAVSRMEGSTWRQRIPDDVFDRRLLVPIPSPTDQEAIATVLDAVDKAITCTKAAHWRSLPRTQKVKCRTLEVTCLELRRSNVALLGGRNSAGSRRAPGRFSYSP
jgi:type I restriction enzyme S subunit